MANMIEQLQAYVYTDEEKIFFENLLPWESRYWKQKGKIMVQFKESIKNDLLFKQKYCCYYCERIIYNTAGIPEREHFADKKTYPQYMFTPTNIVLACHSCNEVIEGKGNYDVIDNTNTLIGCSDKDYKLLKFIIPHPYYDKKSDHIEFDGEKWIIKNCSDKGDNMWKLFPGLSFELLKKKIHDNPLIPNSEVEKLFEEITGYPY
ncbi:MAG: hypothetical protein WBA84_09660 [Carnobacterium sp.]|uniref:HNH endonuclease n=1 Tax=Carnobacterium sp. TaxID=48221 RepID=UPI003C70BA14